MYDKVEGSANLKWLFKGVPKLYLGWLKSTRTPPCSCMDITCSLLDIGCRLKLCANVVQAYCDEIYNHWPWFEVETHDVGYIATPLIGYQQGFTLQVCNPTTSNHLISLSLAMHLVYNPLFWSLHLPWNRACGYTEFCIEERAAHKKWRRPVVSSFLPETVTSNGRLAEVLAHNSFLRLQLDS